MQNSFLDPILGSSTKSAIIEALTEKPLTLKELCSKVEKATTKPLTYQAIHKATTEMIETGILQKNGKELMINKEWVEKVAGFAKSIKDAKQSTNQSQPEIKKYILPSFAEAGQFVIKASHDSENPDKKVSICLFRHSWPLFGMTKNDYDLLMETIVESPFFELVQGNTILDKLFSKPLLDMGKKAIIHGSKLNYPYDIVVKGDTVQQIIFPKEILERLDKMYESCKDINDLSIVSLLKDYVVEKNEIPIVIIKDEALADKIRGDAVEELLKHKNEIPKDSLQYLLPKKNNKI